MGVLRSSTETWWSAFVCTVITLIGFLVCHGTFQRCITRSLSISFIYYLRIDPVIILSTIARSTLYPSLLRFLGAFPSPPITGSFFLFLGFLAVAIGAVVIPLAGEAEEEIPNSMSLRLALVALLGRLSSAPVSLSVTSSNGSNSFGFEPSGIAPVGMNRPLRRCSGWT